jgi:4-amino-4-deoxy-L-arabinose transferase-like glycosyltransferase
VAAVALSAYLATLAPGLTFQHFGTDGGDLITAAWTLGVPHPPGYPTYTLLAWLASRLPLGTIAYRVNLLSALCASATAGLVSLTAQALLPAHGHRKLVAVAAGLTLAFSSLFWSQAVITEVYTLLALFASLFLYLLVRWKQTGRDRYLWLAAFSLGLGLGNHVTLALALPPSLILLWPQRRQWLRWRTLLPAAGLFLLGMCVYVYLPLAARHQPPVNWGNPQTWPRFLWMLTAEPYRPLSFALKLTSVSDRLVGWARLFGHQFAWWGLAIALGGTWIWWKRDRSIALFGLAWALLVGTYAFWYSAGDSMVLLLPALTALSIGWAYGACYLLDRLLALGPRWHHTGAVLLALTPLALLLLHWPEATLRHDSSGDAYVKQVLGAVAPAALILVRSDKPTFALWYGQYTQTQRPDVAIVSGPLLAYPWYREQLRALYPELDIPEPKPGYASVDELVREFLVRSYNQRPSYATDPSEKWQDWFMFVQEGSAPVYRVFPQIRWEATK